MVHKENEPSEEGEAFLSHTRASEDASTSVPEMRSPRRRGAMWYLRILLDAAMAVTIVFLLSSHSTLTRETIRKTPVPRLPRKIYKFFSDPQYTRKDMFLNETTTLQTLHSWLPLSTKSRGYVVINDPQKYNLPEPYQIQVDRRKEGPGYMMSSFHQLHCLSYLAEHFQQGYGGIALDEEVAHHSAHCFNYLRQGIMCAADTTLEGKTEEGPGEGSEHECTDYDALLEWANEHAAMDWANSPIPQEGGIL
ncbi:hypothetical protein P154DRAFT_524513 [Amniculicola lignicola CBS 123094]|uniref:Oxidase ustYa n=1 Tax=Amniculicola lignicola CBS 123094 TaxID=1392246 RepID=A0A6A5WCA4_9PLEO|nr:hypothetical protein P154DRAFT_524513 [Amniculicola lignicola CBS 123094]